ncbi:uncharacterized protein [Nicotiana sylvestris]|uniref:uncharacterized protein n=1 Tax=Nicotiana sylvestris TaxID=4096 RepID=UPI00388CEB75
MANQELDVSVIDPSREGEESDVNLKEEMYKLKQQMAEMYQVLLKGHPPPLYPANPAFVPPLAQSSSEPLFQAHDNQYYPSEPTFKAPEPYSYTPRFDLPVKTEKPSKNPEQEEMFRKVKSLEQSFRDMQGLGGFKMPKFDLYDGHGDPVAHLRGFCSKIRGAGGKDELLMYNLKIILDRLSLTKVEKKHNESFREYDFWWREQAARVDLPMKESEMVDYFLQALEPTYYGHMVSAIGKSFIEVVKMGGMAETIGYAEADRVKIAKSFLEKS